MASSSLSNYSNLHQKCICEMCNCGKHKCPKPHLKGDFHTSYEKDYPIYQGGSPTQSFKKCPVYQTSHYSPNELMSNYQAEYIAKQGAGRPISVFQRNAKSSIIQGGQFQGESAYTNAYKQFSGKYGDLRANILKKQNVLPNLPFEGQSHYVENFTGLSSAPPQKIRAKGNLQVGSGKFDGESTYNKNYIHMSPKREQKIVPFGNLSIGQGRFEGDSTYAKNYSGAQGSPAQKVNMRNQLSLQGGKFSGQSNYSQNYTGSIGYPSSKIVIQGQLGLNEGKFDSSTTYNANYDAKAVHLQHGERPPSQKNLLKNDNKSYNDKTSYTSNYQGNVGERGQKIIHKSDLKLGHGDIFDGESAYTKAYREMKPQVRGMIKPKNNNGILPNGNFEGDSTYTAHYNEVRGTPTQPVRYKDAPWNQGAFNGSTTYGDNYIQKQAQRISCPVESLNPPKQNPLDQQHMRFNARLGVWV